MITNKEIMDAMIAGAEEIHRLREEIKALKIGNLKKAKDILEGQCVIEGRVADKFTVNGVHILGWYLSVVRGNPAILDGEFTADELEAIAAWMRDPEGVMAS